MNYYEILQISVNASEEVVRASYKAMCKKYHPDVFKDGGSKMRQVNEAYEVLSDSKKRAEYDVELERIRINTESKMNESSESKLKENKEDAKFDEESEKKISITGIFIVDMLLVAVGGIGYVVFQIIYFGFSIALLLLIIGFFTGHSQELIGEVFEWLKGIVNTWMN